MKDNPLVSILWLNYNSSPFTEIALESLNNVQNLEYPNYELIAVDNGSSDGSFKVLEEIIEDMNIKYKIINLERNLGFTGGNNVAYRAKSLDSKYVVLLNNDAVPCADSLTNLVGEMEKDKMLGSAQGVILNYDGKSIDTAGGFDSELLTSYLFLNGREAGAMDKEICISHANGAYAIYRICAVEQAMGNCNELLDHELFGFREDDVIGFRLWNSGFKAKAFPFIVGRHERSSSLGRTALKRLYLSLRNWVIINEITNSRYKSWIELIIARYGFMSSVVFGKRKDLKERPSVFLKTVQKAINDGRRIGRKKRLNGFLDIYKAPIIKVSPSVAFQGALVNLERVHRDIRKKLAKMA
jgi:GT2 family glycosyltransferase